MAAKGTIAKQKIAQKIAEIFGADFIGEIDKKLYLWCEENGERIQVAISMTCPKNPITSAESVTSAPSNGNWDFEDMPRPQVISTPNVEITKEEEKNIADLMAKLGL